MCIRPSGISISIADNKMCNALFLWSASAKEEERKKGLSLLPSSSSCLNTFSLSPNAKTNIFYAHNQKYIN
jgi:hypothetical protein